MKSPVNRPTFFDLAVSEAEQAVAAGEVPVGAVIVSNDGAVLSQAHNLVLTTFDPTAHAEIVAIRAACRTLGSERLIDCDLYVTLEPCAMCTAAISFARIRRLYFGAFDEKAGAVESGVRFFSSPSCHHRPDVYGGIDEARCSTILREFFANKRSR